MDQAQDDMYRNNQSIDLILCGYCYTIGNSLLQTPVLMVNNLILSIISQEVDHLTKQAPLIRSFVHRPYYQIGVASSTISRPPYLHRDPPHHRPPTIASSAATPPRAYQASSAASHIRQTPHPAVQPATPANPKVPRKVLPACWSASL